MKSPRCLSLLVVILAYSGAWAANGLPVGSKSTPTSSATVSSSGEALIPGPQRSFLRMAGISQKVSPEEVLPLLSRNVFIQGFQGSSHPTEFLILLRRYVVQARDLASLAAGSGMVLRVTNCEDAKPLLHILGYRTRENCGHPETALQTDDPERAFLAIDSGFPLPDLERTLQGGKPFEYQYSSSPVPVLFAESDWAISGKKNSTENSRDLLDTILYDADLARLYWALSRMDSETSKFLLHSLGIQKLLPYGGVLDFYGREVCIREGKVKVPGGAGAENQWKDLVGASPASPADFVYKLVAKDKGWLAAYFDVLSRASNKNQAYFTDPQRLRLFYNGLRTPNPTTKATYGTFRPAPALLLLATRLQFDESGEPLIPGGLAEWREIFARGHENSSFHNWAKQTVRWNRPDEFIQTMFGLSRFPTEDGPLQIYMAINDLDSRRIAGQHLTRATVGLLARKYAEFSDQYRIFAEFPELSDQSITRFLEVAQSLNNAPSALRANAYGIFQANVGIWQILARQGQISNSHLNDSWMRVIEPFAGIRSAAQLYDSGQRSLGEIFRFCLGKPHGSQDEIIELLAGPSQTTAEGKRMHQVVADRIRAVLDDQRLVSLDTLTVVGNGLEEKAQGKRPEDYVVMLASETREFEMPRPIFTNGERSEWAAGIYNNSHTDVEMRTNLPKLLAAPTVSRAQIDDARGQLAAFLRDTLVGLNYAYYEPPGAQMLHNNPLFVRSHDFAGETVSGVKTLWQSPELLGQGSPAGGGAHFVGSLADLPYALAVVEQDFIAPDSVQALIWAEITPQLFTSAVVPRWWNVSPLELHAIALYQKSGEELLNASATNQDLRNKVLAILSNRVLPQQLTEMEGQIAAGHVSEMLPNIMPAETFYLGAQFQSHCANDAGTFGSATQELCQLSKEHPEVNWQRLSHDFGTPHPSIAGNYGPELLNVPTMPPFSGSASRFLAESWDSPNLYWARLADESGYSPVMLNQFVPELTRLMVQKIFATDFEDWRALLRAMHEAGADFRDGKLASFPKLTAVKQ